MEPPRRNQVPISKAKLNSTMMSAPRVPRGNMNVTMNQTIARRTDPFAPSHLDYASDFAHNSYLQSILRNEILDASLEQQHAKLSGQIQYQKDRLQQRKAQEHTLESQMDLMEGQGDIIELVELLAENLKELGVVYSAHNISDPLERVVALLENECEKVVFKNIRKLKSPQDYELLSDTIRQLKLTSDKIIKSGRDIEGMRTVADKIREYLDKRRRLHEKQKETFEMQKTSLYGLLQNLSDMFANQRNNSNLE